MLDARVKAIVSMAQARKAKNGGGKIGSIVATCGFKSISDLQAFLETSPLDKAAIDNAGIDLGAEAYIGHRNVKEVSRRDCSIPQSEEMPKTFGGIAEADIVSVERMLKLGAPFRTAAARVGLREVVLRKACLESEELTKRLLIAEASYAETFFQELKTAMNVAASDGSLKPFLDAAAAKFPEAYGQVVAQQAPEAIKLRRLSSVDDGLVEAVQSKAQPYVIVSEEQDNGSEAE